MLYLNKLRHGIQYPGCSISGRLMNHDRLINDYRGYFVIMVKITAHCTVCCPLLSIHNTHGCICRACGCLGRNIHYRKLSHMGNAFC